MSNATATAEMPFPKIRDDMDDRLSKQAKVLSGDNQAPARETAKRFWFN